MKGLGVNVKLLETKITKHYLSFSPMAYLSFDLLTVHDLCRTFLRAFNLRLQEYSIKWGNSFEGKNVH